MTFTIIQVEFKISYTMSETWRSHRLTYAVRYKLGNPGIPIIIRPGAGVSYRRLPARCWIRMAVTQTSGTIRLRHTTLQQHLRRQIIRSSRSACVERPSCYPAQHRSDNGHFLQTSQNCFCSCNKLYKSSKRHAASRGLSATVDRFVIDDIYRIYFAYEYNCYRLWRFLCVS